MSEAEESVRGHCRFCPPPCKSCEPSDCECYMHQDWPDTALDQRGATRLSRCIALPGCDGYSHDIRCNNALYGGMATPRPPRAPDTHSRPSPSW